MAATQITASVKSSPCSRARSYLAPASTDDSKGENVAIEMSTKTVLKGRFDIISWPQARETA